VDKVVEKCGSDAQNILLSREYGLSRGQIRRLANAEKDEQKAFLKELLDSEARPRKSKQKARKSKRITLVTQPKAFVKELFKQLDLTRLEAIAKLLTEELARKAQEENSASKKEPPKRKGSSSK
jgi:hypothetical protein